MKRQSLRERFFQDYARKIVMDKRGKTHVEYVYEGDYYTAQVTDRGWIIRKAGLLLLLALSVFLLLSVMLTELEANHSQDIVLFQVIVLFLLMGGCVGMASRLAHGRRLRRREYRMAVRTLMECSFLSACALTVLILDFGISFLSGRWVWEGAAAGILIRLLLLLAVQFGTVVLVRRETYAIEASRDMPHGIDITNDFVNF